MSKYIVEFMNSAKEIRTIAEVNTGDECSQTIAAFLKEHNYESHYWRFFPAGLHPIVRSNNKIQVDVGSWSEFFFISHSDGSAITLEEITGSANEK